MRLFFLSLIFLLVATSVQDVQAQEVQIKYVVVTNDGNRFVGMLANNLDDQIVLDTDQFGRLFFQKKELRDHFPYDEDRLVDELSSTDRMNGVLYFINQSALSLKKGEMLYQNNWLIFNQLHVGITDRLTATGGFVVAGDLGLWLNAKYSFPVKETLNLSAGAMMITVLGESSSVGFLYGKSTFGTHQNNFSVGVGFGYAGEEFGRTPAFLLEGMAHLGSSFYFVGEAYIIPDDGSQVIWTAGFRKNFKKWSIELAALGISFDSSIWGAIPLLGIKVPIRKK